MLKNMGTTAPGWQLEVTAMAAPAGARVAGEIDMATMPIFDLALELLAGCAGDVVIDLSGVTFIDIGGARALAHATTQVRDAGRRLWMREPSPEVRHLIDMLGWASLYDWEPGMSLATSAAVVPLRAERKPVPAHRLMPSASAA
ncbi:STAS domain-containing protein [Actinoplanes sp. Pm04-4]|uniref:STAS domain-containing protein n=1 Tax=Paractinoplanes pyxinae TaxID=2997416 RepID=A0ABT4AYS1_9ACTN|nr:STAS domain-containing protein [Actinoplanes pyxinae]MCY1139396.1 STAS domain-containing protein [Actinoplanes pyxinae]